MLAQLASRVPAAAAQGDSRHPGITMYVNLTQMCGSSPSSLAYINVPRAGVIWVLEQWEGPDLLVQV